MDILTTGGAGQMRAFWRQSSLLHRPPPPPNNNNNNPTHFRLAATTTNNYSLGNPSLYLTRPPHLSWRWGPRSSCTRDGVVDSSSSPLGLRERLPLGGEVEDADAQQLDNPEIEIGGPDPDDDDDHHHKVRNAGIAVEEADVRHELMMLSLPAIAGQAIDPLTQLMETAYIGRLGPVELGSAGVSITIFNVVSKLFNIPLLSVATSFVAEDISKSETEEESASDEGNQDGGNGKPTHSTAERKQLSSVSTALLLASGIGIFEALALFFGSGLFLNLMGIHSGSPMRIPAQKFLSLRSLGAPAVVLSLALQGIFRGFKDTKTPVFCLGFGNLTAVVMFPVLMYSCKLGVTGAAISTVLSQYLVTFAMLWQLNKRVVLLPPNMGGLQFGVYMKSGGFLIGRTLAVLTTMTLATSMAARQGPIAMAAHQICMQVWLAVSLLTDALAASGQAMIASYISKGDYKKVREVTNFVLMVGVLTGVSLAAILGLSFSSMSTLFTNDSEVLNIVRTGVLFVSGSQPINALAFIFDGLHYGVSDFPYAACSMMLVGALSSVFLLYAPTILGLRGVWSGLALFMGLRAAAGYFRLLSKTGPWWFMHKDLQSAPLVAT